MIFPAACRRPPHTLPPHQQCGSALPDQCQLLPLPVWIQLNCATAAHSFGQRLTCSVTAPSTSDWLPPVSLLKMVRER